MRHWRQAAMMLVFAILALPSGATATVCAVGARDGRPIIIGQSFEVRSTVLGGTRRVNIYLPEHYGAAARRFPVLFLLDGGEREDFLHIAALAQITAAYGEGSEMIVVGVEGVDRRHDLTSRSTVSSDLKVAPTSGGADAYRRFLIDELKPWIAARYRVSGHTAIIGESLAGLFVLETLLADPNAFDNYISISPSLWWNGGKLSNSAANAFRAATFSGERLWIGFETPPPPTSEADKERQQQDRLERAFRLTRPAGLNWMVTHFQEGHRSVYHPAALAALKNLYAISVPASP